MHNVIIKTSGNFLPEKLYIFDFVFSCLGLKWLVLESSENKNTELYFNGQCVLTCVNDFWLRAEQEWLSPSIIPTSFKRLDVPAEFDLGESYLPVFFGDNRFHINESHIDVSFDVFGTIFFLLTGYEERVQVFDAGRFPFQKSILNKFNLIERPLVDEYVWFLYSAMKQCGIELSEYKKSETLKVSCDVDNPFATHMPVTTYIKNLIASFVQTKKIPNLAGLIKPYISSNAYDDPYVAGILKIMNENEKINSVVTFNFISCITSYEMDGLVPFDEYKYDFIFKEIVDRGHKIGIHPGYLSYSNESYMRKSFESFRSRVSEYIGDNEALTGRQHYLNWNYAKTDRLLCLNDLHEDSSIGFAESIGFRCGTSRRFRIFDYEQRTALSLYEQPLIVMEDSLLSQRYMNLGYTDQAYQRVLSCFNKCKKFGGKMTLLWHNCHLGTDKDVDFYRQLLLIK